MKNLEKIIAPFRNIIGLSGGYMFARSGTMVMYTLLPVILSAMWNAKIAGVLIMLMTMFQIFLFGPLAANLVDTYGSKKILFGYAGFFIIGAILRYASYRVHDPIIKMILVGLMMLCFAAGYGCAFVDVYTIRTAPFGKTGIAFGILVTLSGVGNFLGTMLQPHFLQSTLQIYAPFLLIGVMAIFAISILFIRSDLEPDKEYMDYAQQIKSRVSTSLVGILGGYKRTFYRGWRFIVRCRHFPLIPLIISFFSGIYFASIWFLVPMYFAQHPDIVSTGLEIGVYEINAVCVALLFGYIADKGHSMRNVVIGWIGVLLGVGILYVHPSVSMLILVGAIVGVSNSFLYATGQHILGKNNVDHDNDGAYVQTRSIINNIGYMFMPLFWGLIIHLDFSLLLKLFASIISSIALLGLIVAFYLLVMRERRKKI